MSKLVRIGNAAFALDKVAAVEGDRVVFTDGKEIRVSKKSAEGLLSEIMAPTPAVPPVPGPFPSEAWYEGLMAALLDLDRAWPSPTRNSRRCIGPSRSRSLPSLPRRAGDEARLSGMRSGRVLQERGARPGEPP